MPEGPKSTAEAGHKCPTLLPFSLLPDDWEAKSLPKRRARFVGKRHISQSINQWDLCEDKGERGHMWTSVTACGFIQNCIIPLWSQAE